MFDTVLNRQFSPVIKRCITILLKLSYSDSAVARTLPKLKEVTEADFYRTTLFKFRGNFIENLFINKFQETVLEYPEIDTIEEVEVLKKHFSLAQKLITGLSEKKEIAAVDLKPTDAVSTLKNYELIGFKLPRLQRGFGYLQSEYTFVQEALGLDPSLSKTISEVEDFGIHLINLFGSEVQKQQYLRKLVTGEITACFAHIESGSLVSFQRDSLNTTASLSPDTGNYVISGTKKWTYNAHNADLFILLANVISNSGEKQLKPTLFLIDKNTPGIEIPEPIKTIGLKNLKVSDVIFNNVVVPESSVLGKIGEGDLLVKKVLSKGKLSNGGHCLAIMRQFINKAIQHCIHNEFFRKDKCECDYFRVKLGKMISRMYMVESMTYLLTGRLDSYVNADVFLESLIVKIFASESLQFIVEQCIEILGIDFFKSDDDLFQLSRDSQFYAACDDSNDHLRIILSTAGVKYAMKHKKERSFVTAAQETFNRQNLGTYVEPEDYFVCKNILQGYLHPMFEHESRALEDSVFVLSKCTSHLIKKYRESVFERDLELKYLADIVINVYAVLATLGRASRAYCLAVKLHELDRVCAECETKLAFMKVRQTKEFILKPKVEQLNLKKVSSHLIGGKYSQFYPVLRNVTSQN